MRQNFLNQIGENRYQAAVSKAALSIGDISLTRVLPPLPTPLKTASGALTHAPLLVVEMRFSGGITDLSYAFSRNRPIETAAYAA